MTIAAACDPLVMLLFIVKGYPVIDGVLEVNDVTFARFFNLSDCSNHGVYAIGNNPLSPDAVHPMQVTGCTRLNTDKESIAYYYPPDPEWIVQEVMDHMIHNVNYYVDHYYRIVLIWIVMVLNML